MARKRINQFDQSRSIASDAGLPTIEFVTNLNAAFQSLQAQVNDLTEIVAAIQAAQAAADNANRVLKVANSYTKALSTTAHILTAKIMGSDPTKAEIIIAAHNRHYGDTGAVVAVNGSTLTNLALNKLFYVFYDDEQTAGGTVTYLSASNSTAYITSAQTGAAPFPYRHFVGSIQTPAEGGEPATGGGTRPPGSIPPWKDPYGDVGEI